MEQQAFFDLSYGVFLLSTKTVEVANGCITDTCIQIANDPARFVISVMNVNYTCELIKKSRIFNVSIFDQTCPPDWIQRFGMQSGREVDKFAGMELPYDVNGVPFLTDHVCSVISCKVVDSKDLGSHTIFIGEACDAKKLGDGNPLTYAYYQEHIKPKPKKVENDREIIGWRCKICKYVYEGKELPADYICPVCGYGAEEFEPIYKE